MLLLQEVARAEVLDIVRRARVFEFLSWSPEEARDRVRCSLDDCIIGHLAQLLEYFLSQELLELREGKEDRALFRSAETSTLLVFFLDVDTVHHSRVHDDLHRVVVSIATSAVEHTSAAVVVSATGQLRLALTGMTAR